MKTTRDCPGIDRYASARKRRLRKFRSFRGRVLGAPIEKELKSAIHGLKWTDIGGGVFGTIRIQTHRGLVDRVCGELGIKPIISLWEFCSERIIESGMR